MFLFCFCAGVIMPLYMSSRFRMQLIKQTEDDLNRALGYLPYGKPSEKSLDISKAVSQSRFNWIEIITNAFDRKRKTG